MDFHFPKVPMSPQEEANSCAALLYLQDLVEARLLVLDMEIDRPRTEKFLADLKARGFEPDEKRAIDLGVELAAHIGGAIQPIPPGSSFFE